MLHALLLTSDLIPVHSKSQNRYFDFSTQSIHCDVVFGSPSVECQGTGICKISGTNSRAVDRPNKDCQKTQGVLLKRPDISGVTLIFFRTALCIHLYRRHFWKGILKVDECCELPEDLCVQAGMQTCRIVPGRYAVTEGEGFFSVDLEIEPA